MSWLDALTEDKDLANQEAALARLPARPIGTFQGFWKATAQGVPRGLLEGGATMESVTGNLLGSLAAGAGHPMGTLNTEARDTIAQPFDEAATGIMTEAQKFRPDPNTGTAGQIGNEITAIIPRTVIGTAAGGPVGGALAAGAPVYGSESMRLQSEGIDAATADRAALLSAITTGAGALIPGSSAFKTFVGKLGSTVGGNVAFGGLQRYGTHEILAAGGYTAQADQYRALDGKAALADATLGLFFLGVDAGATRLRGSEVDEALRVRQDLHAQLDTAPGVPVSPADSRAHATRLDLAIKQALAGEKVDVAAVAGDGIFVRPAGTKPPSLPLADPLQVDVRQSSLDLILGLETNGNPSAKNPRSTATGLGQFTDATWLATVAKHRPDLTEGKSKSAILALRADGALSREMTGHLLDDNFAALQGQGIAPTPMNGYLAHHFGVSRVGKMLANPDARMESILTGKEIDANPSYRGKTVAEVMARFEARAAKAGVRAQPVADVPTLARLPDVAPTFVLPRTGTEAAAVIDRTLAEIDAAGAQQLPPKRVQALETELQTITERLRKNDQAERSGVVRADPRSRITADQRTELAARQVEIRTALEQHRSAVAQTRRGGELRAKLDKIELDSELIVLADQLSPPVRRPSNARPEQLTKSGANPKDSSVPAKPAEIDATPTQEGTPPAASATARPKVVPIRPVATAAALPEVAAVRAVADQSPGLAVIAGADADGRATYSAIADELDGIEADHQQQVREAEAYDRAVACFLRRG